MPVDYDNPAPLNYSTGTLASSIVVPGRICVYSINIHSTKGAGQYINVFDANAVPADTAVPLLTFAIATNGDVNRNFENGRQFQTGLVLCTSSTDATKTLGSADCFFDVQFDVYEEQNAPGTGA